ncbi:MAG TPA: signal peptide peptidase SppA [Vulgatibacter sp.]|nr:signal peptide peptidase SppA [Vulgatibacter sp.]
MRIRPATPLLLTLIFASPAAAQATGVLDRFPSSGLDQPAGSASLTDGPNALAVNPAGLGFQRGLSLMYLHETGPGTRGGFDTADGDGLYLGDRILGFIGFGVGVEWVRPNASDDELHYRRTSWALSVGDESISLGGAAHVFTRGLMDDRTTWDLGLMVRPVRFASVGFAVRDLFGPSAGGVALPRHYVASIGARPFGDWLTLAVDGEVLGAENEDVAHGFGSMALGYTGIARILRGVSVFTSFTHRVDGGDPLVIQGGLSLDVDGLGLFGTPLARTKGGDAGFLLGATLRAYEVPPFEPSPRPKVVQVDLEKALASRNELRLFPGEPRDPLLDFVAGVEALALDDRVQGLILDVRSPDLGMGRAFEVRRALEAFRRRGKKVALLLHQADDAIYSLAAAADKVWVTPDAALFVNGFTSDALFFGGTLEMIGVSVDVAKVGAYKDAPDAFTRRDATDAQKEVTRSLLDDIWPRYLAEMAAARGMSEARFRGAVDRGILSPEEAIDLGLADEAIYPDQLEERAGALLGEPAHLSREVPFGPRRWASWGPAPEIAVIPIEGTITAGFSEGGFGLVQTTGARTVVKSLQEAAGDPQVRAIVLRIDSSGGDAGGSQLIWRAVVEARRKKPVIAVMSDVAASGGYFAAAAAERIFAAPDTLTGSIGIFWIKPSLEGLLGKLEVGIDREQRGAHAGIADPTRPWSPGEQEAAQRWVDTFYRIFVQAVAEGRGLGFDEVDAVARGRVWTGAQAKERRLVDELGGLSDALRAARVAGGLAPDAPVRYRVYKPTAGLLRSEAGAWTLGVNASVELPTPLREALLAKIPPPLLVSNPSGLWAIAPFDWKPR